MPGFDSPNSILSVESPVPVIVISSDDDDLPPTVIFVPEGVDAQVAQDSPSGGSSPPGWLSEDDIFMDEDRNLLDLPIQPPAPLDLDYIDAPNFDPTAHHKYTHPA